MTPQPPTRTDGGREPLPTARRALLRTLAGAGVLGAVGVPASAVPTGGQSTGVHVTFRRCHVAFVAGAASVSSVDVYYADHDDRRRAVTGIDSEGTDPRRHPPLVVEHDPEADRLQLQLAEPGGSLVSVVVNHGGGRLVARNPDDACVPHGFNAPPTASFEVSDPEPVVGDDVTFTSTASDPDEPEELRHDWDLDGDDTFETTGPDVATSYGTAQEVTVRHRVTDALGEEDVTGKTITVRPRRTPYPDTQVAKLLAGDATKLDLFGRSVSVSGDRALVGAPAAGPEMIGAGYVFGRGADGTWSQSSRLVPSGVESNAGVGFAVCLDGDTAVLGSEIAGALNEGAAYVFTDEGGGWGPTATLEAHDADMGHRLGRSVALDGDTVVVGAPPADGTGAAYVFSADGTEDAKLLPSAAASGDRVGEAVDVAGDLALVGAPESDHSGSNEGAAYRYERDASGSWGSSTELVPASRTDDAQFGASVAVDGDSCVVGAPGTGEVVVFAADGTQLATVTPTAGPVDGFGASVSLDGDVLLVGAPGADVEDSDAGAAYVFTATPSGWTEQATLTAGDAGADDAFGASVCLDGGTGLVGAALEDELATDAGAAYVFE